MTEKDIKEWIEHIKNIAEDPEAAHSEEDALRRDFIKYISTLIIPIARKATLVLETDNMKFERWCA